MEPPPSVRERVGPGSVGLFGAVTGATAAYALAGDLYFLVAGGVVCGAAGWSLLRARRRNGGPLGDTTRTEQFVVLFAMLLGAQLIANPGDGESTTEIASFLLVVGVWVLGVGFGALSALDDRE